MYASKDVGHTYCPTFKIDVVRLEVDIAKKRKVAEEEHRLLRI